MLNQPAIAKMAAQLRQKIDPPPQPGIEIAHGKGRLAED